MQIDKEERLQLSDDKFDDIVAAQVSGKAPTLVVRGTGARTEWNTGQAADRWARMRGKFRDTLSGPDGGPITVAITDLSDEELRQRLAENAAKAGLKVRNA